jgi:phosphopantetheinyl transferase
MAALTVFWNLVKGHSGGEERLLSPAEADRLVGMRFALRRNSFLLGRRAAKQLLRLHPACGGLPPTAITVANHPAGGPFAVVDGRELPCSLSISHCSDAAVCALVIPAGVSVGIDLEAVEDRSSAFVQDFFTAEEASYVAALAETEQAAWVTRVWSAKEAVLKASGVGLRVDSRSVSIFASAGGQRKDGWQPLHAAGPALEGRACRVWWRPSGEQVITLVVLADAGALLESESIFLQQVSEMVPNPAALAFPHFV